MPERISYIVSQDMQPDFWTQATQHLGSCDPVMNRLIDVHATTVFSRRDDAFATLARAIVGQKVSARSAASVWRKLLDRLPVLTPQQVLELDGAALRECGVSGRKALYLHDLARHFRDGLLRVEHWPELDSESITEDLMQVKGIGRWTADMFLIFHLQRPDILPLGDVGVQRAMRLLYNENQPLSPQQMLEIASRWQPWRSVATWYLWRSLAVVQVEL